MALTEGIGGFLSVSTTIPESDLPTAYASVTFTEVGEATEIPDHGASHDVVTFTPLKTAIVNKFHGAKNNGSITVPAGLDLEDPGQNILRSALASKDEITFKETLSDGSAYGFRGKVMGHPHGQSVGSVVMTNFSIEITSDLVLLP